MTAEQALLDKILASGSGEALQSDAPQLTISADSKYISVVLNSDLAQWFRQQVDGSKTYGALPSEMPMPQLKSGERQELIELVDRVAAMSEAERRADAGNTVLALNDLILDFYQITVEEEGLIYAALGLHAEDAAGRVSEGEAAVLRGGDAN